MNKGLWIARKNHLFCTIKKVSDGYGGDEEKFLESHFLEVLDMYPGEQIEIPIVFYEKMVKELNFYTRKLW